MPDASPCISPVLYRRNAATDQGGRSPARSTGVGRAFLSAKTGVAMLPRGQDHLAVYTRPYRGIGAPKIAP
jgi:hypothetical protein